MISAFDAASTSTRDDDIYSSETNSMDTPTHSDGERGPPVPPKPIIHDHRQLGAHDTDVPNSLASSHPNRVDEARDTSSLSSKDVVVAVMGVTGSGKSTFISLLADQNVEVGHSLTSCTTEVGVYAYSRSEDQTIYLVDTPGFDDTNRSDADILKDIAFFLSTIYSKRVNFAGIIYLHRITDTRMGGSALKNLRMFQKLCGERGLPGVILATTMWATLEASQAGRETGRRRVLELRRPEFWGKMEEGGSAIVKHEGTVESARAIISRLVEKGTKVVLDIQVELVDDKKTLDETAAGQYIQKELLDARKRFEKDLADYQESIECALQEKDHETLLAIQQEKAAAEALEAARAHDRQKLNITAQQLAQEKDHEYRALAVSLQRNRSWHRHPDGHDHDNDNGNDDQEQGWQQQQQAAESHIRELRRALDEGERRHAAEMARLQQAQLSQTVAEVRRINQMAFEREQTWEAERRRIQHRLQRDRRVREADDHDRMMLIGERARPVAFIFGFFVKEILPRYVRSRLWI